MDWAQVLIDRFHGRRGWHAEAMAGGGFQPTRGDLTADDLRSRHLSGDECLGFYLLNEDNTVVCSALDFDNKEWASDPLWMTKIESAYLACAKLGVDTVCEVSQSGHAGHLWLFCAEPTPAWLVRKFWRVVCQDAGVPIDEIYPRQDRLSGKGMGSLIRYPLFGKSRFICAETYEEFEPADLANVRETTKGELVQAIYSLTGTMPQEPAAAECSQRLPEAVSRLLNQGPSLLLSRWQGSLEGLSDASTSALLQSIACELVKAYVSPTDIAAAIRHWCSQNDYAKGEREDWIDLTIEHAYQFVANRGAGDTQATATVRDAMRDFATRWFAGQMDPVPTGIGVIDDNIGGFLPGELIVVAGRPSNGKTSAAVQMAEQLAKRGHKCLFISEEMSRTLIGQRYVTRRVGKIGTGADAQAMVDAKIAAAGWADQIFLRTYVGNIDDAEAEIDRYVRLHGVAFVFVDYLQLLSGRKGSEYENVSDVSRRLKQAALRHNIVVVSLCQLNRASEYREDAKPKMSDLRSSGQIEQDADTIIFGAHRGRTSPGLGPMYYEFYFAKRRNGHIVAPEAWTTFNTETQRFGEESDAALDAT